MPYVNKPRPYKKEYEQYHGTEKQKKKRAANNAARRLMIAIQKSNFYILRPSIGAAK